MHHGQQWLITPSKKRKRPGAYTSLKRRVKAPLESCMCSRTRGHQYPGALSYRRPTDNSYLCKAVFLRSTGTGTECRPQARIYAGERRFFRQPFLPRTACNRESMQLQSSNLTEANPRTCLRSIFFPLFETWRKARVFFLWLLLSTVDEYYIGMLFTINNELGLCGGLGKSTDTWRYDIGIQCFVCWNYVC